MTSLLNMNIFKMTTALICLYSTLTLLETCIFTNYVIYLGWLLSYHVLYEIIQELLIKSID